MSFPKKLLICTEKPINRNKEYQISDFSYIDAPDYNTNRLEFPLNINLELNMQCLTDCCYCYADRKCSTKETLKTSRIIELIHEASNYNLKNFDINGGEVMLHPDIRIILKELKGCGFDPLVSTKIPLDIETLRFFKEIDLRKFQISLDSFDDNVLSRMLHTPKGYIDKIKRTLTNACKLNIEVGINTVLTKYNGDIQQIEALMQLLSEFNCIKRVRLNPTGYSLYNSNFNNIKLSIPELEAIESQLSIWQDLYGIRVSMSPYDCKYMFSGKYKNEKFPIRALCTGNVWNMVILPDGKVTICEELYKKSNFIIGDVTENSIADVWNSKRALDLYNVAFNLNKQGACSNCPDLYNCRKGAGVCWKMVIMAYGDQYWDFPDPRCPKAPFPTKGSIMKTHNNEDYIP